MSYLITCIFTTVIECEHEIESIRKAMVEHEDFNGRQIFDHLNNLEKDTMIEKEELYKYLTNNNVEDITLEDCENIIHVYDSCRDGSL